MPAALTADCPILRTRKRRCRARRNTGSLAHTTAPEIAAVILNTTDHIATTAQGGRMVV
ncbi:hypothetical protein AB0N06_04085 [Streptomyces sp. NPDC051020]|uniref:hypothetical protein n=1 Tax=Streptomyces sp. NPDC051020 TaxID=3155409 RepID=UPI003426811F